MTILRKRILPAVLSLVMALTMLMALPTAAHAVDPDIPVATKNYDLYVRNDVAFTVAIGDVATGIDSVTDTTNSHTLGAGAYSYAGSTLSILNAYLSTLTLTAGNSVNFEVEFDDGTIVTITVNVIDTTPVCEIVGGAQYATINAALAAVANGQTIRLITDVTLVDNLAFSNGKTFTFNTNGKTLDFDGYCLFIDNATKVTINGCANLADLQYINVTGNGTEAVLNGNLMLDDFLWVGEKARATINGNISVLVKDALSITDEAVVTMNGNITAGDTGVILSGNSPVLIMNGNIQGDYCGLWVSSFGEGWTENASATITGNVRGGEYGIFARECDGSVINVDGNVVSGDVGIYGAHSDTIIGVTGNVTAGYLGIEAWDDVRIAVRGNIVVTETNNTDLNCGVFAGFGAQVTVDGTITAPNYVGFYILGADPLGGDPWYYYVGADDITVPTLLPGYHQYDDEGAYDMTTSFVWVKFDAFILPQTPGTGDGGALWLLIGALLVVALGCGSVLVYRRRSRKA